MQAAIAIDTWKLSIFERHLRQSGYAYSKANGLTDNTMMLSVATNNMEALGEVVKAANTEAAKTGEQK